MINIEDIKIRLANSKKLVKGKRGIWKELTYQELRFQIRIVEILLKEIRMRDREIEKLRKDKE